MRLVEQRAQVTPPETSDSQDEPEGLTADSLKAWLNADAEGRSQRKLAKTTGISQSKISDFVNGKDRLTDAEKKMIRTEITPETAKKENVVDFESYRQAAC